MTPRELETRWTRAQVARAREAAWRTVAGYHWTEFGGRRSWLVQAACYLIVLAALSPHLYKIFSHPGHLDATAILAGFCVLGLAYLPVQTWHWLHNRGQSGWPSTDMVEGYDYGPASVRMDGNGIAWSRALVDQSMAWPAITTIAEDREFFVLASGETLALMLPRTPSMREALEEVANGIAGADVIRAVP